MLVVEDEGTVRDFTTKVLDRAGYEVLVARDGDEALRLVEGTDDPIEVSPSGAIASLSASQVWANR